MMLHIIQLDQSRLKNTVFALKYSMKFIGVISGLGLITEGVLYKYGSWIAYKVGAVSVMVYSNQEIAHFAVADGNSALFDVTATFAEILNKISPSIFHKIDANEILKKGIESSNLPMVQASMIHADLHVVNKDGFVLERALAQAQKSAEWYEIAKRIIDETNLSQTPKLLHNIIESGKKELVDAAVAQVVNNPEPFASELVEMLVKKATAKAIQPYFGFFIQKYPQVVDYILKKQGFNFGEPDKFNKIPLDYFLQLQGKDVDSLVSAVVSLTPANLGKHHLWIAYQNGLVKTVEELDNKIFRNDNDAKRAFYEDPMGKNQGSFLHLMAGGAIPHNTEQFRYVYEFLKKCTGQNPFLVEGLGHLDVPTTAAALDTDTCAPIMKIMQQRDCDEECRQILENQDFQAFLSQNFVLWGFFNKILQESDNIDIIVLSLEQQATQQQVIASYSKLKGNQVIQMTRQQSKKLLHSTTQGMIEFKEQKESAQEDSEVGMTKAVELSAIDYTLIQQKKYIIGGMLAKQVTMYKGIFIEAERFYTKLFGTTVFFVGGYLEAYGRGYQNPFYDAIIGTGIFAYAEWVQVPHIEYTALEQRGLIDFASKYGIFIVMTVPGKAIAYRFADAFTGGTIGGISVLLKHSAIVVSIALVQSYNLYTADNITIEKKESSYWDYITFENAAAMSVAAYTGYICFPVLTASVVAIKTSGDTALAVGMFTLNMFNAYTSVYSAFVIAKLTYTTVSSTVNSEPVIYIGEFAKKSAQDFIQYGPDELGKAFIQMKEFVQNWIEFGYSKLIETGETVLDNIQFTRQYMKEIVQDTFNNVEETSSMEQCTVKSMGEVFENVCYSELAF